MVTSQQLASRLDEVGFSEIVVIRNKILALERQGRDILSFHGGEPFVPTPDPVKDACIKALAENHTRYAPSSGIPQLLEAIIEKVRLKNRIPAEPGQAIVVSGGLHGLFVSFLSVVNPGDEVLVFSPYWTPIKDLVALAGGRQVLIPFQQVRAEGMEATLTRHLTERTRVMYFNSPANPNGVVFSRQEVQQAAEFARRHDLLVIADEAYEDVVFDVEHVSMASLPGMLERTLTVFTLSKSYAMTGWRIGYVIATEPWMTGIRKLTLYSINGVNTPTQWAAVAALRLGEDYLQPIRDAYRRRRDLLVDGLRSVGFACDPPQGSFYAFPDVSQRLGEDSWKASLHLLETASISTVPGVVFGPHGQGHLRFCFSTSIETIEKAIDRLKRLNL
ncbi:MAG: pyridoxal phosphate-dependent aminotransferase [Acidobacteria bacterium]|nr:MAG: pyridoxal phosphate-dependent aminotransferase [Acidobacteriota bacterium]